ncbi:MAG: hypothetical protein FWD49_05305 [Firmicutes bacterium]|nr:hypothetical protein [Bacillota bacterium]
MKTRKEIEEKIGYSFKNATLLETAFTHSSYANEKKITSNERLEYLGDSIVNFIAGEYLYKRFQGKDEGFLSQNRALIVCGDTLCEAVEKADLVKYLVTAGGAIVQDAKKSVKMRAGLFEAVVGAIYLDGGMAVAKKFIISKLGDALKQIKP